MLELPTPQLLTAGSDSFHELETVILQQVAEIETWFRQQWQQTPPPITSSVDLRHAGFKLAPVDTNLFPAGFNNLNPDFLSLCIQAAQAFISERHPHCTKLLIIPESHTRNRFYLQSLCILRDIFSKAGFVVRIGSIDPEIKSPTSIAVDENSNLMIEPVLRRDNKLYLEDFKPCLVLLNNDLSTGIPEVLKGLNQLIEPSPNLGWSNRLKSNHFKYYEAVAQEFSALIGIDSWLINPLFASMDQVDFMTEDGLECLAAKADKLLKAIQEKYTAYGINHEPFLAIKADNGTYGMGVMMVREAHELLNLNRKQRTRMSASKGRQKVTRVILQEGIYTQEVMSDGAAAEPVVYMLGQFVVGGFYRIHEGRGSSDNLNAPGMYFKPLAFTQPCNIPDEEASVVECPNRFYVYGVIARLAALAAARESAALPFGDV